MGIIVRLNQQRTDCPPKSDFTTPKNHYIAFCQSNNSIPIYMQAWWLDAVCTDGSWDVCLAYNDAEQIKIIHFTHPYTRMRRERRHLDSRKQTFFLSEIIY